jgi:predicted aconitase
MKLTEQEERMLTGDEGEPTKWAMELIVAMGDYFEAPGLVDISSAACGMYTTGGLDIIEGLAEQGAKFRVPTATNPPPFNLDDGPSLGVTEKTMEKHQRFEDAIKSMGASLTKTCYIPAMMTYPSYGQHAAWGESSTATFLNSVVGARVTNHSVPDGLACAIAGKVPEYLYHTDAYRQGNALVHLTAGLGKHSDWDALAMALANKLSCGYTTIPVFDGLPRNANQDQLKRLCTIGAGPLGSSMFHAVGVTPGADTIEQALGGKKPVEEIEISEADIAEVYAQWDGAGDVDYVQFGCPHLSLNEYRELALLFEGKKIHSRTQVLIFVPDSVKAIGDYAGITKTLEDAGCSIRPGSTIVFYQNEPELRAQFVNKVMVTDSTRAAFYAPGVAGASNLRAILRSREDAVDVAVAGRV